MAEAVVSAYIYVLLAWFAVSIVFAWLWSRAPQKSRNNKD